MTNEITEHLNKAKALLIEKYSDSGDVEASKEALKNIKQDFAYLEIYANESDTKQPQNTLKSIIEDFQKLTHKPYEVSEGDLDVYSDIISGELDRLLEAIGLTDLSITAEVKDKLPENTVKAQLQDLHALNDSMFYNDDKYGTPRFTDGTEITAKDLADMNINALDNIAELIGFELNE